MKTCDMCRQQKREISTYSIKQQGVEILVSICNPCNRYNEKNPEGFCEMISRRIAAEVKRCKECFAACNDSDPCICKDVEKYFKGK